jgi:hypothetical protein
MQKGAPPALGTAPLCLLHICQIQQTLLAFVFRFNLPAKDSLAASTVNGFNVIWKLVKSKSKKDWILKDIATAYMQTLFDAVGKIHTQQEKNGDKLSVNNLRNGGESSTTFFNWPRSEDISPPMPRTPSSWLIFPRANPQRRRTSTLCRKRS